MSSYQICWQLVQLILDHSFVHSSLRQHWMVQPLSFCLLYLPPFFFFFFTFKRSCYFLQRCVESQRNLPASFHAHKPCTQSTSLCGVILRFYAPPLVCVVGKKFSLSFVLVFHSFSGGLILDWSSWDYPRDISLSQFSWTTTKSPLSHFTQVARDHSVTGVNLLTLVLILDQSLYFLQLRGTNWHCCLCSHREIPVKVVPGVVWGED